LRPTRFWSAALALALAFAPLAPAPAPAAPLDITLHFASLPSAQGFTYAAVGAHAGVAEAAVFGVDGTKLVQNTMGQAIGAAGGSILYQVAGGVTATETKRIFARARCLAQEGSASATLGQGGYIWGFNTGSVQYGFGLTSARLSVLQPGGTTVLAGTYDNTQFHDYIFLWTPPGSWQLFRDGVLVGSGSGGFSASGSRLFLGDGTGGANAHGEMSAFRFTQDLATAARPETWSRVKALFR
jgi:hypothetical protein